MKTVWIVTGTQGQYSDHRLWIHSSYSTKDRANKVRDALNNFLDRRRMLQVKGDKKKYPDMDWDEEAEFDEETKRMMKEVDPNVGDYLCYTGIVYVIEEVSLDDLEILRQI